MREGRRNALPSPAGETRARKREGALLSCVRSCGPGAAPASRPWAPLRPCRSATISVVSARVAVTCAVWPGVRKGPTAHHSAVGR